MALDPIEVTVPPSEADQSVSLRRIETVPDLPSGNAGPDFVGGNVPQDQRTRTDDRAVPDGHAVRERRICADPDVVADRHAEGAGCHAALLEERAVGEAESGLEGRGEERGVRRRPCSGRVHADRLTNTVPDRTEPSNDQVFQARVRRDVASYTQAATSQTHSPMDSIVSFERALEVDVAGKVEVHRAGPFERKPQNPPQKREDRHRVASSPRLAGQEAPGWNARKTAWLWTMRSRYHGRVCVLTSANANLHHVGVQSSKQVSDRILGMRIDRTSYIASTKRIIQWAREGRSAMICLGNVHMVMTSYMEPSFADALEDADLVTHDGMPLVWALRLLGHTGLERVYGPHLMTFVCQAAAKRGIAIGLYGGSPSVLADLATALQKRHPGLKIPFQVSPPFRPTTKEEDDESLRTLRASGARILFVGIGCPKQELWIHKNRRRFTGPMLGVGQAFDIHSGHVRMAPRWLQNIGMEWAYRLCTEPRRLWRRYLRNNPQFLILIIMQVFAHRIRPAGGGAFEPLYKYIDSVVQPRLRGAAGSGRRRR